MKRILLIAACIAAMASASAQGLVNFANRNSSGLTAPIFDTDGTTRFAGGTAFLAQLWAGKTAESLAPIGTTTTFGTSAGYLKASNQIIPASIVTGGGSVWLQVRVWDATSATYSDTVKHGISAAWNQAKTANAALEPLPTPEDLIGLASFSMQPGGGTAIPEPSTIALGVLAAGALLAFRRK